MRVAYLTEWFRPEIEGVPSWVADSLAAKGFDVGVITGAPHYPSGRVASGFGATDWRLDRDGALGVLRVPEFPSHDRSTLRRMATYGSFALSSSILAARSVGQADVALVYSSPATSAAAAIVARRIWGTPYVLYVQDLWPDSIFDTGLLEGRIERTAVHRVVSSFVRACYRDAAHICVISAGMGRRLEESGVPSDKMTVIPNWVDEQGLRPRSSSGELTRLLGLASDCFVVLYAGNLGEAQALGAWVAAMRRFVNSPEAPHLVFLGSGTQGDALRSEATRLGVSELVHFLGPVIQEKVACLAADADVMCVSLADTPLFEITIPSKLQASLAMARPVIAACRGDVAEIVESSGAGWVAIPGDPDSIANAIGAARSVERSVRDEMGRCGYGFYMASMSEAVGSERLSGVIRKAASSR